MSSNEAEVAGIVLDSWAVLSLIEGESEGRVVKDVLELAEGNTEAAETLQEKFGLMFTRPRLYMSIINLGEVFYIVGKRRNEKEARYVVAWIKRGPVEIIEASERFVFRAGKFKITYPISYADAFALATAAIKKAHLLTGDPEIGKVKEVPLLWIGRETN